MRIATISSKRQVTLAKSLLEKYALYPSNKVILEEKEGGLMLKPMKESIVAATFGSLSRYVPKVKKGLSYSQIIKNTKKIVSRKRAK